MELNVRFVELPLHERSFDSQTQAVQSRTSLRKMTITETGIAMMSAIVGKRLPTVLKRDLAVALQETIDGQLEAGGGTEGDLLAQIYGEIFGPLFTCLERDGDFTIIRLAVPKGKADSTRRADFLLLDQSKSIVILQEAKGHCCDYEAVSQEPDFLDVCRDLRAMRNKGRSQLIWPNPEMLTMNRVRIEGCPHPAVSPVPCGEQSVVATIVPDGRLGSATFQIDPPAHVACESPCTSCLHSPATNLITVLSSERLDDDQPLPPGYTTFLDWYKACERAVWGRAHGSFGNAVASLVNSWQRLEMPSNVRVESTPLITGIVEEAIHQAVYVDFRPVWQSFEEIRPPDSLVAMVRRLHDVQGDVPRPPIREGSTEQLGRLLFGHEGEKPSGESISGNWLVMARQAGSHSEGTASEIYVAPPRGGLLEVMLVPRGASGQDSVLDLCWGLAELISGGHFPPEVIYDSFNEELVEWSRVEADEMKGHRLGRSLCDLWWPWWPWIVDRHLLDEMHHCCPGCSELAHFIERWWDHWPEPFFPHRYWRHHHHRAPPWSSWSYPFGPIAFVTSDARALLRIPRAAPSR